MTYSKSLSLSPGSVPATAGATFQVLDITDDEGFLADNAFDTFDTFQIQCILYSMPIVLYRRIGSERSDTLCILLTCK